MFYLFTQYFKSLRKNEKAEENQDDVAVWAKTFFIEVCIFIVEAMVTVSVS